MALPQALRIDLRWFIIQEEVAIVYDTPWVEPLDDESQAFEVNKDLNKTFLYHLNSVHLVTRLEDKLSGVILLRSNCIDKLVQNRSGDSFLEKIDFLQHAQDVSLPIIVVSLNAFLKYVLEIWKFLKQ